ncbi:MAG: ATP-binding protein [Rhodothermales bacterium]
MDDLFEQHVVYPDPDARDRLNRLIGLDEHKARLGKILSLLVNPGGMARWATEHHPNAVGLLEGVLRRPPLVVLSGDVGAGKTELASTIGDAVARLEDIDVTLFPLSLATRGQGRVGEMTQLLAAAFDYTVEQAARLKTTSGKARGAVLLLVDEADAIAQSRENAQMHHEDRAGVNAFIRGIDRIGDARLPAAVIMCTNRLSALDPAIKRRAADILTFRRPGEDQRRAVLGRLLTGLKFGKDDIQKLVNATGILTDRPYGFTFSDITQRLIPAIVLDAYPTEPVRPSRALEIAHTLVPTPPFNDGLLP